MNTQNNKTLLELGFKVVATKYLLRAFILTAITLIPLFYRIHEFIIFIVILALAIVTINIGLFSINFLFFYKFSLYKLANFLFSRKGSNIKLQALTYNIIVKYSLLSFAALFLIFAFFIFYIWSTMTLNFVSVPNDNSADSFSMIIVLLAISIIFLSAYSCQLTLKAKVINGLCGSKIANNKNEIREKNINLEEEYRSNIENNKN